VALSAEAAQEVWPDGCVELLFILGNTFLANADGSSHPFPKVTVLIADTDHAGEE
jgi:hypothetical protein